MSYSRSHLTSPYMEYAKLHSASKYNLATSGIQPMTMAELGARLEDLEINGGAPYGYPALQNRIAAHCGVQPECIVTAIGTSLANHLAMAACFEPGDDVLIEHPGYEPLLSTARFLGANVIRFERREGDGFRLDLVAIERAITPRTRLIVVCNLHNPTSAFTDEATLAKVGEIARSVRARVLVDEVYLEAMNPRPLTSFLLGNEFVVTNSLTKGYGLGGLRCGWILAEPELARCIWALYDVFSGHNPYPAEALSMVAFDHLNRIRGRAQRILEANRPVMNTFLRERCDLECDIPEFGTCAAPRLKRGSVEALDQLLREKYDTAIVPGRFFEMPEHFRIGIGADPAMTHEGFRRLSAALDELGGGS
jgi:aspartate/methionine/tyrosine aminotransferase